MVEENNKPKVLLFCDNPYCFAEHIAKKHFMNDANCTKDEVKG